ncbi:PREDICTED: uncharacterized protein LOC103595880 [Galeopterus variegatus]|uniref:Uncharacterized protein LOC103595880 n=1 Tax=Galeopterus variegatus TaxID=482537 RepID=A0ABM0RAI7_GALVR|nr:PREDICTED: uncharacterized protein LOC103595880 [Galeopterus variegatus]
MMTKEVCTEGGMSKDLEKIGALKDYYHFYHSRTIKRSVLSSRGSHSFISMEPKWSSQWGLVEPYVEVIQDYTGATERFKFQIRVLSKDKSRCGHLSLVAHSALLACPLEAQLLSSSGPRLLETVKVAACHFLHQPISSSTTSPPSWSCGDRPLWKRSSTVPMQPTILDFSLGKPGPGP